ncbi:MAG: PilZ domain-containing protein [Candidatus Omnitrophica bacterium]|nr:PilZ domain-containing protein [Candidatus Omnitrophota bacterium]
MMGKEQREWHRVTVNMPAKCRVVDGPARYDLVEITDMHHQGCCIHGDVVLEQGQVVRLVLELPFEGPINITGEVAWSGPISSHEDIRTGLRFKMNDLAAEDTCLKLYNFCLLRQPKQ